MASFASNMFIEKRKQALFHLRVLDANMGGEATKVTAHTYLKEGLALACGALTMAVQNEVGRAG